MRISEMLNAIASWLESSNNEALLLAEYNDECLKVVAESCLEAATALKKAAEHVDAIEPAEESKITPESIEELANLASAFDLSGDPELKKQASVIDELLLTIAAPPNAVSEKKIAENKRIEDLRKKYEEPTKELQDNNKIADSLKALEKSPMMKEVEIYQHGLSSRNCPDHAGAQMARVGESEWQCELDKKIYNYETGFELNNGSKFPGGNVSNQTTPLNVPSHSIFDTRIERLHTNK